MVLATVSSQGWPSARAVILRGLDERGFLFFTDTRSAKASELGANPRAALVFLWSGSERQVRVGGRVTPVPDEEADAFFATRPREANLAAEIAPQGEVIAGREVLERRLRQLRTASERLGGAVPRAGAAMSWPPTRSSSGRVALTTSTTGCATDAGGWRVERLAP